MKRSLKDLSQKIKRLLETRLWLKVIIALVLGVLAGVALGPDLGLVSSESAETITNWLALPGNLFLQMVKMIIIPLVFSSIILGIISSGDPAFLKKIGPRLVLYFVITTIAAITIGFIISYTIKPGAFVDTQNLSLALEAPGDKAAIANYEFNKSIPELLVNLLPSNPLESMVTGDMLSVVIYTIFIVMALLMLNAKHQKPLIDLLETVQELTMTIVRWAMELVPVAVFGLMSQITSHMGITALGGIGMYILTVWIGLLLLTLFYNIIILLFAKVKPGEFMNAIKGVQLLAFSTSSSAAVMPLSIRTAEDQLNVKPEIAQFLIPVGATINMDGTALYQVTATIFLAQVFGIELSMANILLIMVITVGASIGAPSAPGVGIVILATILESVGIPTAGIALILGVDRILDMSRTAVNVTGDLTACCFFDKQLGDLFDKKSTSVFSRITYAAKKG